MCYSYEHFNLLYCCFENIWSMSVDGFIKDSSAFTPLLPSSSQRQALRVDILSAEYIRRDRNSFRGTPPPSHLRQKTIPLGWCHRVFLAPSRKDSALAQVDRSLASFLSDHCGQRRSDGLQTWPHQEPGHREQRLKIQKRIGVLPGHSCGLSYFMICVTKRNC